MILRMEKDPCMMVGDLSQHNYGTRAGCFESGLVVHPNLSLMSIRVKARRESPEALG